MQHYPFYTQPTGSEKVTMKNIITTFLTFMLIQFFALSAQAEGIQSRAVIGDTCGVQGIFYKRVAESDKSLNLSSEFTLSNEVTLSYTTSWAGTMWCSSDGVIVNDHVYFFTGLNSQPVYLKFVSSDADESYWIKITAEITGATKDTVSGIIGSHSIGNYQTQYTLHAELLTSAPTGVDNITKTTTNGVLTFIPAVMSGKGSGSDSPILSSKTYAWRAWSNMMADTARSGWDTDYFLAYEKITVQFEPKQTTCNMTHDMTVKLPKAALNKLKQDGMANGADFTIPIKCASISGITTATRGIKAWLSSNDLVENDSSNETMMNDESTARGVGIAIRSRSLAGSYETVKLSSSTDMGSATQIMDIAKDESISDTQYIYLHAYYKVYDASSLTTGTVVATAQIMFGYD